MIGRRDFCRGLLGLWAVGILPIKAEPDLVEHSYGGKKFYTDPREVVLTIGTDAVGIVPNSLSFHEGLSDRDFARLYGEHSWVSTEMRRLGKQARGPLTVIPLAVLLLLPACVSVPREPSFCRSATEALAPAGMAPDPGRMMLAYRRCVTSLPDWERKLEPR